MVAFVHLILFTTLLSTNANTWDALLEIIESGTVINECGGACTDLMNLENKELADLALCLASVTRHSECKLTYAAPATLTVLGTCPDDAQAVRVSITGVSTWILGTEMGTTIGAASDITEKEPCQVEVYDGAECNSTNIVGTLDLSAKSQTRLNLEGSRAIVKATTTECAARLTERYIRGKTIVAALGGSGLQVGSPAEAAIELGVAFLSAWLALC
eukprot:Blabericola_migrator_1__5261@NODE_2702_length_2442_cov_560_344000_g1690_i0_p3_GENE_NODE_2702_length_2442_cov_560_344000_g1690_i0NODE_2702_length_2442_cov_560_344000_g1690_i0_p3_ORF_typecomplete_len216_score29_04_NODE_2702_length_2442_cov_560_344000_g1690_i016922339